jgi:integrase
LAPEEQPVASLSKDPKSGVYRIHFRFGQPPRQFQKSLKTTDEKEAETEKGRVESTLAAIEKGWLPIPLTADLWTFLKSGGKLETRPTFAEVLTLKALFDRYEEMLPPGAMEANSRGTCRGHQKHLLRVLGGKRPAQDLTVTDLQDYVNKRTKEKYRGKPIKSRTAKKEVDTFRAVWNWATLHGLLRGPAPSRGVRYDKADAKPPFMTWAEVEARIKRGGLTDDQVKELWDSLFLDKDQIGRLLEHVKRRPVLPYVYPMFVFVAHTGVRRSEMVRSQVEDFDFDAGTVTVREKKRDRTMKLTFRQVQMSPLLREVMSDWFRDNHPGGPHAFCQPDVVARSRRRSKTTGHKGEKTRATTLKGRLADVHERTDRPVRVPLTRDEATYWLKEALSGSKWSVVKGFHVFRHSFASNMAKAEVRQEVIDAWLGHQTEEMRKRYRHLFPEEKQDAIKRVFGRTPPGDEGGHRRRSGRAGGRGGDPRS